MYRIIYIYFLNFGFSYLKLASGILVSMFFSDYVSIILVVVVG